ncbi:helix-turn-helix domain-containing protein [Streptococcus uberis]|uniref:helix-turn-helix domain-containing protein n=1 Tax=Streptococcus uberis TaxID=1349 RepID=UPI001FF2E180|nr:helix-turn-helix transcriptional regulator [Streptococcus uberis]MCK1226160.1 helix-turn-helix domain-containing protein [Streptococcus uberis]
MLKDNLKKARMETGLTQKQVAEKMNITQQQYAKWESGIRNPKDDTLDKLADIFNTTTDALKGRDDGLEDIITTLRKYDPTEDEKADIQALIVSYFMDKR